MEQAGSGGSLRGGAAVPTTTTRHGGRIHLDDSLQELTHSIIGAAIAVHRELGPGLLESAYALCLARELEVTGLNLQREVPVAVTYRDLRLDQGYRLDMLVEGQVVVELKVVAKIERVHIAQLMTYLRLAERRVGLLFNFNVETLGSGGIRRVLNGW